ncbi:MAG: hypothetical protein IJM90_07530 [Firmicutes bacterium]|nr:hypothetical protein [Bacillota bacterium]
MANNTNIAEICSRYGLQYHAAAGVYIGILDNYPTILSAANNQYVFHFSIKSNLGEGPTQPEMQSIVSQCDALRSCTVNRYSASFALKAGRPAKIAEYLEKALRELPTYLNARGYTTCCGLTGDTNSPVEPYFIGGQFWLLSPDAYARLSETIVQKEAEENQKPENPIGGAVGAFLGALIGGGAIILFSRLGLVSALSGVAMGFCALKGYELLGGKLSTKGIIISAVIMLAMVYLADRADWAITASQYFKGMSFFDAFRLIPEMIKAGNIDSSKYTGNLVMLVFFTALGAVPTIINAVKNKKISNTTFKL